MSENTPTTEVTYKNRHVSRFIGIISIYSCILKSGELKDLTKVSKKMILSYLTKDIFDFDLSDTIFKDTVLATPDPEFLENLMRISIDKEEEINQLIKNSLNEKWNFDRLDNVIKAILKMASAELLFNQEVPTNIIIDEYVSLTKTFYENNEAGFVNKVLDVAATKARDTLS